MTNPRNEAVRLLLKTEKDSSYSVIALSNTLKKSDFADPRDLRLAVSLFYGVLEHRLTLDYNISLYLKTGIKKLNNTVLQILRTGAYQILYSDRIPVSAAVNEAVKSSKKFKVQFASGMINAVLRKISDRGICLPGEDDKINYLSVKYSVSPDIVKHFINENGEDKTIEILESFFGRRPIYIRHNSLACSGEELTSELMKSGVKVNKTDLGGCFSVDCTGDIAELPAYKKGYFHVQDKSSQLCCSLACVKPGQTVVDCCAAPGGKSFTLAEIMENKGVLYSCDIYEHKTKLIKDGASRLGIENIKTLCSDARELPHMDIKADFVLCDVPCSGLGVAGRKPEIRYKSAADLSSLPSVQSEILEACCSMVKDGGCLIYSTCTLNNAENRDVCDEFLKNHKEFSVADDENYRKFTKKYISVLPSADGGDGFFIAKFIRGHI